MTINPTPRVSIIIPTYNCAQYIVQTIESVFAQAYQDYELIVIDDGSTDNTREVLVPYLDRLIYLYQANQGESVARNVGIQHTRGEYIAFLDSDDWWLPGKLAKQVAALDAHPDVVLTYGYVFVVDNAGNRIAFRGQQQHGDGVQGKALVFERLVVSNFITNPNSVMVRRNALMKTQLFDIDIEWGEDWQLWLQMALQGSFLFLPEELACYRMRRPGRRLEIESSAEFVQQNELILDRTFAQVAQISAAQQAIVGLRDRLMSIKPAAYRELYLRSALYNVEAGDLNAAANYLQRALKADPQINFAPLADQVAHIGFRIAGEQHDFAKGAQFVERFFDHAPAQAQTWRAKALAELHMAAAFHEFAQGHRQDTRHHVAAAFRAHPATLGNRGLWSIGLKSL